MASLELTIRTTDIREFSKLAVRVAEFVYMDKISAEDFKKQAKQLLEQIGVTPETHYLGGGDNATT